MDFPRTAAHRGNTSPLRPSAALVPERASPGAIQPEAALGPVAAPAFDEVVARDGRSMPGGLALHPGLGSLAVGDHRSGNLAAEIAQHLATLPSPPLANAGPLPLKVGALMTAVAGGRVAVLEPYQARGDLSRQGWSWVQFEVERGAKAGAAVGAGLGPATAGVFAGGAKVHSTTLYTLVPPERASELLSASGDAGLFKKLELAVVPPVRMPQISDPSSMQHGDCVREVRSWEISGGAFVGGFGQKTSVYGRIAGEFAVTVAVFEGRYALVAIEPERVASVGVLASSLGLVQSHRERSQVFAAKTLWGFDLGTEPGRVAYQRAIGGVMPDPNAAPVGTHLLRMEEHERVDQVRTLSVSPASYGVASLTSKGTVLAKTADGDAITQHASATKKVALPGSSRAARISVSATRVGPAGVERGAADLRDVTIQFDLRASGDARAWLRQNLGTALGTRLGTPSREVGETYEVSLRCTLQPEDVARLAKTDPQKVMDAANAAGLEGSRQRQLWDVFAKLREESQQLNGTASTGLIEGPEEERAVARPTAGNVLAIRQNQADVVQEEAASLKTATALFALLPKHNLEMTASSEVFKLALERTALLENIYRAPLTPGVTNRQLTDRLKQVREAEALVWRALADVAADPILQDPKICAALPEALRGSAQQEALNEALFTLGDLARFDGVLPGEEGSRSLTPAERLCFTEIPGLLDLFDPVSQAHLLADRARDGRPVEATQLAQVAGRLDEFESKIRSTLGISGSEATATGRQALDQARTLTSPIANAVSRLRVTDGWKRGGALPGVQDPLERIADYEALFIVAADASLGSSGLPEVVREISGFAETISDHDTNGIELAPTSAVLRGEGWKTVHAGEVAREMGSWTHAPSDARLGNALRSAITSALELASNTPLITKGIAVFVFTSGDVSDHALIKPTLSELQRALATQGIRDDFVRVGFYQVGASEKWSARFKVLDGDSEVGGMVEVSRSDLSGEDRHKALLRGLVDPKHDDQNESGMTRAKVRDRLKNLRVR